MSMRVSWDLIASVRAVLEHGSLSAAARSLGVTQPTIRRHIDEIEQALGVPLFTRSPSGLVPTAAARDIEPYARDIEALVAVLLRSASAERDSVSGTIRLACSEIMGSEVLPFLLAPLLADHPRLQIELIASNRNENILRRDADVAVRMVRPDQGGLVARNVGPVPLGLFAAVSYLARKQAPLDMQSLISGHDLIGEDRGTAMADAFGAMANTAQSITFRYRSDSDVAQLAAIRAGLGIGVCQLPLGRSDPRLRQVLPEVTTVMDMWLVTHEDLRHQRRIRALLDHLTGALKQYAADDSAEDGTHSPCP
jgi:DNA-binding transcriptional LysR family regulator